MNKIVGLMASRIWPLLWRYRHLWDRDWSESYKSEEALVHPHRQLILEAISRYEPIESVLEIGCGAGANLELIGKEYSPILLYGYDISESAKLQAVKNKKVLIYVFKELSEYGLCDIVLTDATAIYVSDKNISSFIIALKHYAKKAIILCEWHSDKGPFVKHGHWVHNYKELLPGCKITKLRKEDWPESPGWIEYGAIIQYETR